MIYYFFKINLKLKNSYSYRLFMPRDSIEVHMILPKYSSIWSIISSFKVVFSFVWIVIISVFVNLLKFGLWLWKSERRIGAEILSLWNCVFWIITVSMFVAVRREYFIIKHICRQTRVFIIVLFIISLVTFISFLYNIFIISATRFI